MLRTTKNMKEKYEKIQNYLFALIPEKWDEIYLYASVLTNFNNSQTGEMFFYYIPKGILKKRPVNVYEVPDKFNINEGEYLNIVKELYNVIKDLKQDFVNTDQDLWTNLTISISNCRFKVEYGYDKIPNDEVSKKENRIIWRYKYLKIGGDKKEERKILDKYFSQDIKILKRQEVYETGLYLKTDASNIKFDREERIIPRQVVVYEKENEKENENDSESIVELENNKEEKFEIENKKEKENEEENTTNKEEAKSESGKNQILNTWYYLIKMI